MIDRLKIELPNAKFNLYSSWSFPYDYLENYKNCYQYVNSNPDIFREYYEGFDEDKFNIILDKAKSLKNNEIFSYQFAHHTNNDFTFKNQLIMHKEKNNIEYELNYLEEVIEFHYLVSQYKNELILITDNGLSVLDLTKNEFFDIKATEKIEFAHPENTTYYIEANDHIYFFFIQFGHDDKYYIFDYDPDKHDFYDITPGFDFSFKTEYFWKFENNLYMLRRYDFKIFKFEENDWIEVKEKIVQKEFIQHLSKELILSDGRKLLIDYSGLKVFKK